MTISAKISKQSIAAIYLSIYEQFRPFSFLNQVNERNKTEKLLSTSSPNKSTPYSKDFITYRNNKSIIIIIGIRKKFFLFLSVINQQNSFTTPKTKIKNRIWYPKTIFYIRNILKIRRMIPTILCIRIFKYQRIQTLVKIYAAYCLKYRSVRN